MKSMNVKNVNLLLPVENQVRELDPRLLLACIAARRGFPSVIGPIREVDFHIFSFPRSIYLSKHVLSGRLRMFKIMRQLGLEIVALDEEALVHLPPEIYYSRRLFPDSMAHVSRFLAWGQDNADLWRQYSQFPAGAKIHITGNPRNDLLRPEIRRFYEAEADQLRRNYGDFILINTNFNHVNAFYPKMNLFRPAKNQGEEPQFGRSAKGMTLEFARGLWKHKQAVFKDFQRLIPALEKAFPDYTIVVRPHPIEKQQVYQNIADQCKRVRVTNEGNVVSWLMSTKALIHNGCTTGVEAYVMRVPAISYRATTNELYDDGFYRLPNRLSHQCFNFEELREMMQRILSGEVGATDGDQRKALIDHHLVAQDGPLACERIVDVFEDMFESRSRSSEPDLRDRLIGWYRASRNALNKRYKSLQRSSHLKPDFLRHRYPEISLEEIRNRTSRFQQILGDQRELKIERIFKKFFRISAK
jgi:surface carbohydrate biosynthesis protein